jgi:hypothetical protein
MRIPVDAVAALRRSAEARGPLPSELIRGWALERLRQETTGEALLVFRDELARIVREQVEAALRRPSKPAAPRGMSPLHWAFQGFDHAVIKDVADS